MKSTELIHEIVEEFGTDNNRTELMKALKGLRITACDETKKEVFQGFGLGLEKATGNYYLVRSKYINGT